MQIPACAVWAKIQAGRLPVTAYMRAEAEKLVMRRGGGLPYNNFQTMGSTATATPTLRSKTSIPSEGAVERINFAENMHS